MGADGAKKVLVTGVSGFVGSRFAQFAIERGWDVRSLTRTDWDGPPLIPPANRFTGALPLDVPLEAFAGASTVVHFAAYAGGSERMAQVINVDSTARLARMAKEAGAESFVYISSSSAKESAISAYGRSKLSAEKALLAMKGIRVVIVRPNLVVGPGKRGVFGNMWRMVEGLPVIPMIAGGKSVLQPIHIDDLCEAVCRCVERAGDLDRAVLNLGLPGGMLLRDLLQTIAVKALGKRRLAVPVPLWPIEVVVGLAEKLGIPLPIKSANVQGLKVIDKADTAPDLERLGIILRPVEDFMLAPPRSGGNEADRAMRVLLVGAGKIGPIHAIYLTRTRGVALAGTVDPNPKAAGMLRGMGVSVPAYRSVEDAIKDGGADAAVVATPVFTHLPVARECGRAGMAVMVEKPTGLDRRQLEEFVLLQKEMRKPLAGGWVMLRNPQVEECARRLKAGEFGEVRDFTAVSLLTSVRRPEPKRWETSKKLGGGGSWMAAGGHALSMVHALFGAPASVKSQSLHMFSADVEDSLVAELDYGRFRGAHYCSWSIRGFNRLESTVVVRTDAGTLWVTPGLGFFLRRDGEAQAVHQLDFPGGFNMAPDYAGAGFSREFCELGEAARTGSKAPLDIETALAVDRTLHSAYENGKKVAKFIAVPPAEPLPEPKTWGLKGGNGYPARRILDLRDMGNEPVRQAASLAGWDAFQVYPAQLKAAAGLPQERLRVTVSDFLGQTRLLLSGRALELLRQMGVGGIMSAGMTAMPLALKEKGPTFWVAATGFLVAGMAALPKNFKGTLLLHPYLADLALAVRRPDRLDAMLALIRKAQPWAKIGFHSGMAGEAVNALAMLGTPIDEVSLISSPGSVDAQKWFPQVPSIVALTAEVGMAPVAVHRTAAAAPGRWGIKAPSVLVGGMAEPKVAALRRAEVEDNWDEAFPGLKMPLDIL